MIRVLNIIETMAFGGVERRRLSLAKHLDKATFELKIICTHSYPELAEQFEKEGVEVITIGNFDSPFHWAQHRKVQKVIDDFKPHIIHGAVFEGVTMAAVNGFLKRVPIVLIEETSDPKNRSWKGHFLMKLFSLVSDRVIAVSPAVVDYLTDTLKISPQKTHLITNGVALPREVSNAETIALKNALHIAEKDVVVGSVGRMLMDSHKRFSDLIKSFAKMSQSQSDVSAKLVLVGDGPELENYKALVKTLHVEDKVVFAGYQSDTAKFYSLFDVFSLVSAYEAFGLVLAEAMLHKLPVVATRVGGMQYIVDDNITGYLVDKYDVSQMAEKLGVLCKDGILREKMGEAGFRKAMQTYTEKRYVTNVEDLYKDLLRIKKIA